MYLHSNHREAKRITDACLPDPHISCSERVMKYLPSTDRIDGIIPFVRTLCGSLRTNREFTRWLGVCPGHRRCIAHGASRCKASTDRVCGYVRVQQSAQPQDIELPVEYLLTLCYNGVMLRHEALHNSTVQ